MSKATDLIAEAKSIYRQPENAETSIGLRALLTQITETEITNDLPPAVVSEVWALRSQNLICDVLNQWNGAGTTERDKAEVCAKMALEIDPTLPLAHYTRGFIHRTYGEHAEALAQFEEAVRLRPDYVRALAQVANEMIHCGRVEDAVEVAQRAIEIGGSDLSIGAFYWIKGRAQFYAGNFPGAVESLTRSVPLKANVWYNRCYLVSAHIFHDTRIEALHVLSDFNALFPGYSIEKVKQNEEASPSAHKIVVDGRQLMHQGLSIAGMPAK
jgi:tetratricopeptide (TPR) repeat protein